MGEVFISVSKTEGFKSGLNTYLQGHCGIPEEKLSGSEGDEEAIEAFKARAENGHKEYFRSMVKIKEAPADDAPMKDWDLQWLSSFRSGIKIYIADPGCPILAGSDGKAESRKTKEKPVEIQLPVIRKLDAGSMKEDSGVKKEDVKKETPAGRPTRTKTNGAAKNGHKKPAGNGKKEEKQGGHTLEI